jgi:hypothetical protein
MNDEVNAQVRSIPTTLTVEQLAQVAGVPLSRLRRWVRFRVLTPLGVEGKRHVFSRDDAVLALVLRKLQALVGEKSKVPLSVGRELRPLLASRLREGYVGPVSVAVAGCQLTIGAADLDPINERLDALSKETR